MSQSQLSATAAHPRLGRDAARAVSRGTGRRPPLDRLRVVPAAIGETGSGVFAVICIVLLAAGLGALLMMNTALASGIYQLKGLQAQAGALTDTQEQLTQVVDDLRSPRTLADKAQGLGMVPARSMAFIRLSDGAIIGVAQPATAEQRLNVVTTPVVPPPAPPAAEPVAPTSAPEAAPTPAPEPAPDPAATP
jgi:cell division protein FtsB